MRRETNYSQDSHPEPGGDSLETMLLDDHELTKSLSALVMV
jgi:hypothetical protein